MAATGGAARGRFIEVSEVGERRQARLVDTRLAVVSDARRGSSDLEAHLTACCRGSADALVLRDKTADEGQLLAAAAIFRRVADEYGALFVVNDLPGLARQVGADAVHVGQTDVHPDHARVVAGGDLLIGRTVSTPGQLRAAADEDVDYLVIGPVFDTDDGRTGVGLDFVSHVTGRATCPWFVAGGIDASSIDQVLAAGATRISLGRAMSRSEDPERLAWDLRRQLAG